MHNACIPCVVCAPTTCVLQMLVFCQGPDLPLSGGTICLLFFLSTVLSSQRYYISGVFPGRNPRVVSPLIALPACAAQAAHQHPLMLQASCVSVQWYDGVCSSIGWALMCAAACAPTVCPVSASPNASFHMPPVVWYSVYVGIPRSNESLIPSKQASQQQSAAFPRPEEQICAC
jgi:hypothetical protein